MNFFSDRQKFATPVQLDSLSPSILSNGSGVLFEATVNFHLGLRTALATVAIHLEIVYTILSE